MKYQLRLVASLAVIGSLAIAAAGCSPVAGGSDNVLTISVIDPIELGVMQELAAEFEASHEGVTVKVTQIPEDVYVTKLQTSILANNPPDIAQVLGAGAVIDFQPLDELLYANQGIDIADYNEGVLRGACGFDGQIYCMGGYAGALVLAYNKAIFTEAGIDFPSETEPMTIAEYAALSKQLTFGELAWVADAPPPTYWVDWGLFLDDTGRVAEPTDPTYVEMVTDLSSIILDGSSPSAEQTAALGTDNGALGFFYEGQVAMVIFDPSDAGLSEADIEVGFAPVPVPAGTDAWVSAWTNAYGIPLNARNSELAAEFLALLGTSGQAIEAELGLMPLRNSDAEVYISTSEARAQFASILGLARTTTFTPNMWAWTGIIDDAYNSVLLGDASVEQALSDAEPKVQQALDTTWVSFEAATGAK